jgi:hypothetical protein
MNLYQQLSNFYPYMTSIRRLKNYLSFDINFPKTWQLPKKYIDEKSVLENESEDPNSRFLSFVGEFNEETIESLTSSIKSIIKFNLEREEKQKLFQDKVNELKSLFDGQSLESLKNLVFELDKTKNIKLNGRQTKPAKLVSDTEKEGSIGDIQLQEIDN